MPSVEPDKRPTREEIVRGTGLGFLIPGPTKRPTAVAENLHQEELPEQADAAPPSPPPAVDH